MKTLCIFVFLCVICAVPSLAGLDYIMVEPSEPAVGEPITITVFGWLPNTCWSLLSYQCIEVVGPEIVIDINLYDCSGRECEGCLTVIEYFDVDCTQVLSVAGLYTVRAVEIRNSLYHPGESVMETEIMVTGPVMSEPVSWASIKCLFR